MAIFNFRLPPPVSSTVDRLLAPWEQRADRISSWLSLPGRRSLATTVIAFVTGMLLLANIHLLHGSSPAVAAQHQFFDPAKDLGVRDSIYLGHRRVPRTLVKAEVRAAQEHAFDQVDGTIISKSDMEAMVGRPLPFANATTIQDLNYGHPDDIPDERRNDRVVYFVTPTYRRETQMVDLTRMSQTLQAAAYTQMGIVCWVVIEDADRPTRRVRALLERSGLPFSHVARRSDPTANGRGMAQRNAGIEAARKTAVDGVVYFADDDNAYDIELVTELTRTKSVSIFGVGLVGNGTYERCHVNPETGRVDKLLSGFSFYRTWGIDMAGFAFSTAWDAHKGHVAGFDVHWQSGTLEPRFLSQLIPDPSEFQPLAADCTRMLVWHTRTHIHFAGYREMPNDPEWQYVSSLV